MGLKAHTEKEDDTSEKVVAGFRQQIEQYADLTDQEPSDFAPDEIPGALGMTDVPDVVIEHAIEAAGEENPTVEVSFALCGGCYDLIWKIGPGSLVIGT